MKSKSISYVVVWNVFSRFILKGISFFSAPIFVRLLSPDDYGSVSLYTTWVAFLGVFIGLQSHGSIPNAKIHYDENTINSYLSSALSIGLLSFIFCFIPIVLFAPFFSKLLGFSIDIIVLLVIHSFFSFVVFFYTTKLMQFKQVEKNFIISLLLSLITIFLSIAFIFLLKEKKYVGKIYGVALPQIISGLIFLIIIYSKGKVFYHKEYWHFCIPLVLPLLFHAAGGIILSQSDRVMLEKLQNKTAVGIYSLGYTLALVIESLWNSFNTSWVPFYYEYKKNGQRNTILKRSNNYLLLFSILTIGFILLAPEVFKVIAPKEYWDGIPLLSLIALSYYFTFIYSFPANHEFYHKKTLWISLGTLFAAFFNIALNFLLIPKWSIMGAAISTVGSFALLFLFHDLIARFLIKDYEYCFSFYLKGLVPVIFFSMLYFFVLDYWLFRWGIASLLGIFLFFRVVKTRTLF